MDTKALLQKVKTIEIKTRLLSKQLFSGEYNTAFKGKGMTFSEVKSYQYGDDVRNIDWNVTARFNEPYVKVFEEEREQTIFLLLDVSGSQDFGSSLRSKRELMIEVAAALAFSAVQHNDKVGAIFISDKVEKFIPAKKGRSHAMMLLTQLIKFKPTSSYTKLDEGLKFFKNSVKKRSVAFLISDFIDEHPYVDSLKIANRNNDVVALPLFDDLERKLPSFGLTQFYDAESRQKKWVFSQAKATKKAYEKQFNAHRDALRVIFRKSGVDFVELNTSEEYIKALNNLFKLRRR